MLQDMSMCRGKYSQAGKISRIQAQLSEDLQLGHGRHFSPSHAKVWFQYGIEARQSQSTSSSTASESTSNLHRFELSTIVQVKTAVIFAAIMIINIDALCLLPRRFDCLPFNTDETPKGTPYYFCAGQGGADESLKVR